MFRDRLVFAFQFNKFYSRVHSKSKKIFEKKTFFKKFFDFFKKGNKSNDPKLILEAIVRETAPGSSVTFFLSFLNIGKQIARSSDFCFSTDFCFCFFDKS